MRSSRHIIGLLLSLIILATGSITAQETSDPETYLQHVLEIIEQDAYYSERLDWDSIYDEANEIAQAARTTADVYPFIRGVLRNLQDNHSVFLTPSMAESMRTPERSDTGLRVNYGTGVVWLVVEDSPADQVGIQTGDRLTNINGMPLRAAMRQFDNPVDLSDQRLQFERDGQEDPVVVTLEGATMDNFLLPEGRMLSEDVGYLELFTLTAPDAFQSYAEAIRSFLQSQDEMCGIVLDVRRNGGGNMWPMLAGIGPLLGAEQVGKFVRRDGESIWRYRNNTTYLDDAEVFALPGDDTLAPRYGDLPVAVLTGNYTASSGEIVVISLLGRQDIRLFGNRTSGSPSANSSYELADGALLALTTALTADRDGTVYRGGIRPENRLFVDWAAYNTAEDDILQSARTWLSETHDCHAG